MTTNSGHAVSGATQGVEYAGFWARVAAYFLDYAIIMLLVLVIGLGSSFAGGVVAVIGSVVLFLITLLYWPAMESSARQATFGKSLVGIQVTDLDGGRTTFLRAFLRNIAKVISAFPLGIGFLLAAFTGRKQALHDMITKCLVVRTGPSHLFKALAAAVGGLVIIVGSGGAYFYYVYLPQMKNEITGIMQEATKDTFTVHSVPAMPPVAKVAPPAPAMPATPQVVKELPSTPVVLAAPKPSGAEADLDSLLGPVLTGLARPGTTRVGPAILELSHFWGNNVSIKVHLPLVKGLDVIAPAPEITVNSVLDASGRNYYDGASNFEKGMFLRASLSRDSTPVPHLSGIRSVQIKSGLKEQALQKIEGQVRIFIPVDVKPVAFEASEAGKGKPMHGAVVTLKSFSGAKVALHYRGASKNLLEVRGYGKDGGPVEIESIGGGGDNETVEQQINFKGPVSKVEAFIASGMIERQFPFTLMRGAVAGSPSPATVGAKTTPSVTAIAPEPAKPVPAVPIQTYQPPSATVAAVSEPKALATLPRDNERAAKSSAKRPKRYGPTDLRYCLELQTYEAIAKCAGE